MDCVSHETDLTCVQSYRVELQGQCLRNRQDLRQIWQLRVTKLLYDVSPEQLFRVLVEDILKVFAGLENV